MMVDSLPNKRFRGAFCNKKPITVFLDAREMGRERKHRGEGRGGERRLDGRCHNIDSRELKQRGRRRQRERQKTMGLISKNNRSARAFYVLYISLPSSAKQQRELTKFKVLWRT